MRVEVKRGEVDIVLLTEAVEVELSEIDEEIKLEEVIESLGVPMGDPVIILVELNVEIRDCV